MENSLQTIVGDLETMFQMFNDRFYKGELQSPVITVSPDQTSGAYGWLTSWKAWQREGTEGYYEINMCAEHLNRSYEEVSTTLLHEMVHLWNLQVGVQDTSRGGTYHNKKFKLEADNRGLLISQHAKYGWTLSELSIDGYKFICENETLSEMKEKGFGLHRTKMSKVESKSASKKSSSRKYICSECGNSIRATKDINLICGDCNVAMEIEEKDEE